MHFIGIEQSSEYVQICEARIAHAMTHEPETVQVATKKVKGGGGPPSEGLPNVPHNTIGLGLKVHGGVTYRDQDGMEEVEDWDCHPGGIVTLPAYSFASSNSGDVTPLDSPLSLLDRLSCVLQDLEQYSKPYN